MFGKKKQKPQIDKAQLELIQNAQKRIKQKKRLYIHFVIFLIGAIFLIAANTVLGIGKDVQFFEIDWFVYAILLWLFFFVYHAFNVFITHKFMGKAWEQNQLDKLVAKQQERIDKLKEEFVKEETLIAQSEVYNETTSKAENTNSNSPKSELTIIVAAGENDAIGKDNKLIWHLSDDLKRFKSLTNGHHIIMGRKTFESFPKPLPNRTHVVISRQQDYKVPNGVILVNSLEDAIDASKNDLQPFIIGGGEIYKQAMLIADKIELTRVHESFEADTFFPEIDTSVWKETANTFHKKDENHKYEFSFLTYERV
ncbi:dihydrofolate reductase [Jejuia spongiicola]|uniref:dihydrofolate reductase n=1 Tax=Jejuia spongiicola TaxID=2942207 RepID=A0ABT0QHM1_9FLAO|nr:dihydrofolate reductase [Jejuia spongiicola]MCL6295465.1 dihydrofolate reductase [Jejuia spongiicola]